MTTPRLTFFCELDAEALLQTLSEPVLADLRELQAGLSLGIRDLSPTRAEAVRRLNQAGIPVVAWLLLPKDQGYWFNLDNAEQAAARFEAFRAWTDENGLAWAGVGLDFEPDIRDLEQWATDQWALLPRLLKRSLNLRRQRTGQAAYTRLAAHIRAAGYPVETYQYPVIADERISRSSLLRRLVSLADIRADTEVWMLYTSILRPNGIGVLGSYGPEADAIGIGSTGGGEDPGIGDPRPLDWDEFSRDLRLAWHWSDHIYVFSLEGCLNQGFLPRLKNFIWDQPILLPDEASLRINGLRGTLRSILWLSAHLGPLLAGVLGGFWMLDSLRRLLQRKG